MFNGVQVKNRGKYKSRDALKLLKYSIIPRSRRVLKEL